MKGPMLKALSRLTGYDLESPKGLTAALKDLIGKFEPSILAWKKEVETNLLEDGELYASFKVIAKEGETPDNPDQLVVAVVAFREEEGTGRPVFSRTLFPLMKYSDFVFGAFVADPRFSPKRKSPPVLEEKTDLTTPENE